jgi:predicted ATPase
MKTILITGVFASGKTSLISLIKDELESKQMRTLVIDEVARKCPLELNHEQTFLSTFWMVMKQIENELVSTNQEYDYVIYDRGIPDIIAHTKSILKNNNEEKLVYNKLEELGKTCTQRFDYIFLAKKTDKLIIEKDDIRVVDRAYQEELENIHINYLNCMRLKYIPLPEFNSDRKKFVMSEII